MTKKAPAQSRLEELVIRNLGVIEEATLPLGPGFTAVTGETGAGKTMVVQALGLVLGERADSAAVRAGASGASVEARWLVPNSGDLAERVREAGGEVDELGDTSGLGELVLVRSLSAEGRSRAAAGGRAAPASVLVELGEQLVAVHGQSEQLRLRSQTAQRHALDRFGGTELAALRTAYRATWNTLLASRSELETLTAERDIRLAEAERLRAATIEIDELAPQAGEDVELAAQSERLGNLESLRLAAGEAHEIVSGDGGYSGTDTARDVIAQLDNAKRALERVASHDPALQALVTQLAEAGFLIADISAELGAYLASLDGAAASELDAIEERRAALSVLMRKYGPTLDDVLTFFANSGPRLLELDGDSDRINELSDTVIALERELAERAAAVTAARTAAAETLQNGVSDELRALAMPTARLHIEISALEAPAAHGADDISFLLQSHPGSPPRPLGKGASGGELSRVMLAIEVVLASSDPVPTFIFDEVDSGVGGAAAIEIGRRLAKLSESAQVIVVTHLAQVAAFARNHLTIVKDTSGAISASSIKKLGQDERASEMARLLSGLPDSESGLAHARELLELAHSAGSNLVSR